MFFNRKLTGFEQALGALKERLDTLEREFRAEKSASKHELLEFADLGNKMRKLYLRITRTNKIEQEATSAEPAVNNEPPSPEDVRDAINRQLGV